MLAIMHHRTHSGLRIMCDHLTLRTRYNRSLTTGDILVVVVVVVVYYSSGARSLLIIDKGKRLLVAPPITNAVDVIT